MESSHRRGLVAVVVLALLWPTGTSAQPVWGPVGMPTHSAIGRIGPSESSCRDGTPCQIINLRARDHADAWLEWTDGSVALTMTAWRDGRLVASSRPVGPVAQYLHVDPGRPGPLEFHVTHAQGLAPVTYGLRIWQGEHLKWSLNGASGSSVTVGQGVLIAQDRSRPRKVRIAAIGPDRLVALDKGLPREIPTTWVTRIQRGDSLRNGALIGALAGAGFALDRLGHCEMNCYGAFVPVLGGIGAGIGTVVDALRRSTIVYIESDP